MKTLIIILLTIMTTSCAIRRYSETAYTFDYKNHDHPGFVISPSPIDTKYEALADIRVEFLCGKIKKDADTTGLVQFTHGTTGDIILYAPTDRHVLNRCIEEAKKFGATTLLSFRLTYDNLTLTYTATGIAARPTSPSK